MQNACSRKRATTKTQKISARLRGSITKTSQAEIQHIMELNNFGMQASVEITTTKHSRDDAMGNEERERNA